ncbi:hypothetical protein, partial [Ornithobacterium rhinotracheale]|uniref:hypothetical protein n=1 Tax=Ornithobacterium rhinotracheale TaxID=28251 RepID=UPI0038734D4E
KILKIPNSAHFVIPNFDSESLQAIKNINFAYFSHFIDKSHSPRHIKNAIECLNSWAEIKKKNLHI